MLVYREENDDNNDIRDIPVCEAVEINVNNEMQHAIPYSSNRQFIEKELILSINKLTIFVCILNLPYIFKNFGIYLLRSGSMVICQYYGVFKENICVINVYIGELLINMFFIRPILLVVWFHADSLIILLFECFLIPFESMLLIKIINLRNKIIEYNQIPIAHHSDNNIAVLVDE